MNLKSLALLILFSLSSITIFAFDFEKNGINYTITSDSTVEVSPKEIKYKGTVKIPSSLTYQQKEYIVTRIGDKAFSDSRELFEVVLPETVTEIGVQTFGACHNLRRLNLPAELKSIGKLAFYFCQKLENIYLPEALETLGDDAFSFARLSNQVVIPASVVDVGIAPFRGCYEVTEFVVDEKNPKYSSHQGVLFNKDTTVLLCYPSEKADFHQIPLSVNKIESKAFAGTKKVKEITIPSSVKHIGSEAFYYSNLEKITIEDGLEQIDKLAFYSCENLKTIELPNSLKLLAPEVFHACRALKSVKLPISIPHIPEKAFMYCTSLESIEIPSSVIMIDKLAFSNCTLLKSVSIPSTVVLVEYAPFYNCNQLKKIYLHAPTAYQFTNKYVFTEENLKDVTLVVPKGKLEEYRSHPAWKEVKKFEEKEYFFQVIIAPSEHGEITLWNGDKQVVSGEKLPQGTILNLRLHPDKDYYPKSFKYNYTYEVFSIPAEIDVNMDMVISVLFEKMGIVLEEENLAKN